MGQGSAGFFFGRVNYDYANKYMATAVLRIDGSSKFARGHRWGYFPSVSAGWAISEEAFMESAKSWMDFLKYVPVGDRMVIRRLTAFNIFQRLRLGARIILSDRISRF